MVLRSGVVGNNNHRPLNVEEFRGFSISDPVSPLVFVNARDFRVAQIFTLAHELAHIWAGSGGISNPDYSMRSENADSPIEQFCNRVAAETLVPKKEFQNLWRVDVPSLDHNLNALSIHFKVSGMVILRQAHECGYVSRTDYWNSYDSLVERSVRSQSETQPGGNFHYTLAARNGNSFTQAVISSASDGSLLSSEAADLLGVKVKTLPKIAQHLFGSPLNLD